MGLKDKIIKAVFGSVIQEEIKKSSRQIIEYPTGVSFIEGILPEVDYSTFDRVYKQTSWVRAVVSVIERAVTARGYILIPTKPDADLKNAERLQEFFDNCNPNDTLIEILADLTRDCFIFGNAYVEIVFGADGKPKELWNLDATSIRIKADEHGLVQGYIQIPRYSGKVTNVTFEPKEVLHVKLGSKGSTLYGLSPLMSLVLPITCDLFAMAYNRAFFSNGAKVRGAFIMKDASAEQVERNREYLQARAQNIDMAHSDMVLEGDIEFKQISVAQKDMEFLDLRKFVRDEILGVYGVPPSKIAAIETGNIGAGTGEHQTMNFYEETVNPFQTLLAAKITKQIIRQGFGINDWSFQFTRRPIDEKEQAEIFSLYIQNGVFTAEEVRRMVSPRMPEIEKSANVNGNKGDDIAKGRLKPSQTIVEASRAVVDIENRFVRALENQFRKIKAAIAGKLSVIVRDQVKPKIEKLTPHFETFQHVFRDIAFRHVKFPEVAKQLEDLEVVLELIDSEGLALVVREYSLEAANKALRLTVQRNDLKDISDISAELKEMLESNALNLAGHISESIKASVRQALIEGLRNNETIQELQARVEEQIDSFATVDVRPVTDANGNVVRSGHTRDISRSTAAEAIARTEANRAFNEGNLDALEQADITSVQFLLASDACPECVAVAESVPGDKLGKTLALDDARGLIPVHPNCFPGHVPIFTPAGWKPISQIQIGDEVLTHELRFRKVVKTMSHVYGAEMVRLAYHQSDWRGSVSCTSNHKFLTAAGGWKEAQSLQVGDKVMLLANQCGACSSLIPYWRSFCSRKCVALNEWQRPGHKELVSAKARDQLLREYSSGQRDPNGIVEKAHEVVRRLSSLGLFPKHLEPYHRMGDRSPSCTPEAREKIRQAKLGPKNWMYGRKGPLHHNWRGGKVRYRGKDWNKTSKLIRERDGYKCVACGMTEQESIQKLHASLQVNHIVPFRIKPDNSPDGLITLCVKCHNSLDRTVDRLVYNDTHQYKTVEMAIVQVERFTSPQPIQVFNLQVEEDESYIAKGFVVHNCRCTWVAP